MYICFDTRRVFIKNGSIRRHHIILYNVFLFQTFCCALWMLATMLVRYGAILKELGFTLFTGDGGFYHWCKMPGSLTCMEFNEILFKYDAAILPGTLCDMFRRGESGPMGNFIR